MLRRKDAPFFFAFSSCRKDYDDRMMIGFMTRSANDVDSER